MLRLFVRDAELEEGDGGKTEDGRVVRVYHKESAVSLWRERKMVATR